MAKENITKFFDAVITDKVLAEKVIALAKEKNYPYYDRGTLGIWLIKTAR